MFSLQFIDMQSAINKTSVRSSEYNTDKTKIQEKTAKSITVVQLRITRVSFISAIAMLVDKRAVVLPCEFHAGVARAVCYGHGLSIRRAITSFIQVIDRGRWHGRRSRHIVSLSIVGSSDRRRGRCAFDCRSLSWRGDGPLDERRGSIAGSRFRDRLRASWNR